MTWSAVIFILGIAFIFIGMPLMFCGFIAWLAYKEDIYNKNMEEGNEQQNGRPSANEEQSANGESGRVGGAGNEIRL